MSRVCPKCKLEGEDREFVSRNKHGGLTGWCTTCKSDFAYAIRRLAGIPAKNYNLIDGNKKECGHCHEMKDFAEFGKSETGSAGLKSYCKTCEKVRYNLNIVKRRESSRKSAAKYRRENREIYRARNRIYHFNRKSKIKATSDGTVNESVAKEIYDQESCGYCKKFIPRENRTMDHKIPLNKGGMHTASNLTMACRSCNSIKKDKLIFI